MKSVGTRALHLFWYPLQVFIASFLVVPVAATVYLLPLAKDEITPPIQNPVATKIIERGRVDEQRGSPLFSVLPPEIRNRVFEFACTTYETIPYTPNDWFYRPGYHAHQRISTTLLATCQRIYLETFTLPLRLNEHVFWGTVERGPPKRYWGSENPSRTDLNAFFDCLTPHQRASVQEVHLFAQQFWLEGLDLSSGRIATKKIKITLRHQDWYFWEDDESLGICPWFPGRVEADVMISQTDEVPSLPQDVGDFVGWGRQFELVYGLEEVEFEFETLRSLKELEMDPIVAFAKRWQFPLMGQGVLEWDQGSGIRESTWTGSRLLRGEDDESVPDDYADEADNFNEADDEFGSDNIAYEAGYSHEYSDLGDGAPSLREQDYALAREAEHVYAATVSEVEEGGSDTEHRSNHCDSARGHEAAQMMAVDDADELDDQSPGLAEAPGDARQDGQPVLPLLALESNMQEYYVVSMIWRKRK